MAAKQSLRARTAAQWLPSKMRATTGFIWSLRPYRWSSVAQRTLRHGVRRVRRLPGGRFLAPVPRRGVEADAVATACPVVDPSMARTRLEAAGVAVERFHIDREAFESFLREADFPVWYHGGSSSLGMS